MGWANRLGLEGIDYKEEQNKAAKIGTFAHKAIESYIKGIDYVNTDPRVVQALESFKRWADNMKIKFIALEVSLVCDCGEHPPYGGTVDCIAEMPTGLKVIDWKTSNTIYTDYKIQVATYADRDWETN